MRIFPIFIGDYKNGNYSNYFQSGCHPKCPKVVVSSVESLLIQYFDLFELIPKNKSKTVDSLMNTILTYQGTFWQGSEENSLSYVLQQFDRIGLDINDSGIIDNANLTYGYKSRDGSNLNLIVHPSLDMWSLGCVLYFLCTGSPLFEATAEDNLSNREDMKELFEWDARKKYSRISKITDRNAYNLLSLLLHEDPLQRLSIDSLVNHPFVTSQNVSRLPGIIYIFICLHVRMNIFIKYVFMS